MDPEKVTETLAYLRGVAEERSRIVALLREGAHEAEKVGFAPTANLWVLAKNIEAGAGASQKAPLGKEGSDD